MQRIAAAAEQDGGQLGVARDLAQRPAADRKAPIEQRGRGAGIGAEGFEAGGHRQVRALAAADRQIARVQAAAGDLGQAVVAALAGRPLVVPGARSEDRVERGLERGAGDRVEEALQPAPAVELLGEV